LKSRGKLAIEEPHAPDAAQFAPSDFARRVCVSCYHRQHNNKAAYTALRGALKKSSTQAYGNNFGQNSLLQKKISRKNVSKTQRHQVSLHTVERPDFFQIFHAFCMWPWLGPPLAALGYAIYISGFVNNVMLAHNRPRKGDARKGKGKVNGV